MQNKKTWIKFLVSVLLIYFLFLLVDIKGFITIFASLNVIYVFIALILIILAVIFSGIKQKIILQYYGLSLSTVQAINLYFVGNFFNNFLPSTIGGDIVKIHFIKQRLGEFKNAFMSVFIDRVLGFMSLLIITLPAFFLRFDSLRHKWILLIVILFYLAGLILLIILFNINTMHKIVKNLFPYRYSKRFSFHSIQKIFSTKVMLKLTFLSVTFHSISVVAYYFVALAFHIHTSLTLFFLFIPIISAIGMLPISFNGVGIREFAFMFFFSSSATKEALIAIPLFTYFLTLLVSLYGAYLYVREDWY